MSIMAYAPLDALSNFDNYIADDGTYGGYRNIKHFACDRDFAL